MIRIEDTKVSFTIGGRSKTIDIDNLFEIDENNLSKEFAAQASLFAYFSTLQAESERQVAIATMLKDEEYAKADEYWRAYLDKREKKYTEAVIRSNIIRDEAYQLADTKLMNAVYELGIMKSLVKALQMRAEMLISLGAQLRQEWEMTGMTVRDSAYKDLQESVKKAMREKKQV